MSLRSASFVVIAVLGALLAARSAAAHCDTADGPVVAAAKTALEKGDITPVLKWVRPEAEFEIRAPFHARSRPGTALAYPLSSSSLASAIA